MAMLPQTRQPASLPTATVYSLLCFQNQLRLFHWQTTSYAQHKAFGDIYDAFDDLADRFVEAMIGTHGRPGAPASITLTPLSSDADARATIGSFEKVLFDMDSQFDYDANSDLLNIRDEMLGELRKLKYLLTLK